MGTPDEANRRTASAYNAAADYFDDPANSFRDRFGRRTVERLDLTSGARVLDVCCGSGASAIPAAEAVGPAGQVLAVDLAEDLLALGRAKAQQRGLTQFTCRQGDLLDLGLPEEGLMPSSACSASSSYPTCRPRCARCGGRCGQAGRWP
jgi:ubiquinone/menaquinone biosynthesis C-methylase UbiE